MEKKSVESVGFFCGTCKNNDCGFCDFIGVIVEDDDPPHCTYGSGWEEKEIMYGYNSQSEV